MGLFLDLLLQLLMMYFQSWDEEPIRVHFNYNKKWKNYIYCVVTVGGIKLTHKIFTLRTLILIGKCQFGTTTRVINVRFLMILAFKHRSKAKNTLIEFFMLASVMTHFLIHSSCAQYDVTSSLYSTYIFLLEDDAICVKDDGRCRTLCAYCIIKW